MTRFVSGQGMGVAVSCTTQVGNFSVKLKCHDEPGYGSHAIMCHSIEVEIINPTNPGDSKLPYKDLGFDILMYAGENRANYTLHRQRDSNPYYYKDGALWTNIEMMKAIITACEEICDIHANKRATT